MNTPEPETLAIVSVRDDDSTISIQRIREDDGTTSVALWGTEDSNPDIALAYTLVPEQALIEALAAAGYKVERSEP